MTILESMELGFIILFHLVVSADPIAAHTIIINDEIWARQYPSFFQFTLRRVILF